jgi:hypothetical protein
MKRRIFTEPQEGADYQTLRAVALAADELGWYEAEHAAYGIPFPSLRERFDRIEERGGAAGGVAARRSPGRRGTHHGRSG